MKIDILTLFPEMFEGFLNTSIIKRARDNNYVTINVHNIRDYSLDPHKKVDDYAFGGGSGMVLMPQPIFDAVEALKKDDTLVIMMTPQGIPYKQKMAYDLANQKHLLIICGHYEGFDERIRTIVDIEISIGDYILTGGEIPSMVIIDSVVRLLDGVIEPESHLNESFNDYLLDYPVYTKPQDFRGMKVPEVLLSGHHENIRKWRQNEALNRTSKRRPDLLEKR
jgi:tRNA (guanine37-N1)-methyltransferase